MKKFKQFLENYDVYIETPKGWSSVEGFSVPTDAPNPMSKDTKTKKSQGKEKTEEFPVE